MKFGAFSALLIAVTISAAAIPVARAAIIVDQDALVPPPSGPPLSGRIVTLIGNSAPGIVNLQAGQTVTAGVAGRLDAIELQGFRALQPNLFFGLTLFDGDLSAGGRVIGTINGLAPFGAVATSTFISVASLGYNLLPGQLFSFRIGILSGLPTASATIVIGNFAGATPPAPPPILNFNDYARGVRYNSNNGSPFSLQPIGDLGFRTFVDTAAAGVPEPHSWAMLIIGFGLIGAAARRRKPVLRIS